MGKRSKIGNCNAADKESNVKEKKALTKRKVVIDEPSEFNVDEVDIVSKNKNVKCTQLCNKTETEIKNEPSPDISSRIKKVKNTNVSQTKKITKAQNEPQENPNTNNVEKNKTKKFLNDDEAQVKDEDIDQFCEGIDEEDNAQYENWVKLIEANLQSKRKQPS